MMMSEELFETNIELYAAVQPKVAFLLPYHDFSDLKSGQTGCGEPNLLLGADGRPLHEEKGAKKEAETWRKKLDLQGCDVLYVFGIGLGYYYDALLDWLKEDTERHVVFLENDLSVLAHFLHTMRASAFLKDSQAHLRYSEHLLEDQSLFDWLSWDFLDRNIAVAALYSYASCQSELFEKLVQKLSFSHHRAKEAIDEYLHHGVCYYRNFYSNLSKLPSSYNAAALYGCFKGVPAIICGAGPSLERALPFMQEAKQRALCIAGASAMRVLNAAQLQPHFGVGIDPNRTQYERLQEVGSLDIPFFYRLRMHRAALALLKGPLLYVPGAGGYDTAAWLEEALGITPELCCVDEGHNVVNFSASIALALGCDPIIFVGVDFAYTDMRLYASGTGEEQALEEKEILNDERVDRAAVLREDLHGKPIYTLWKWIAEAEWLGQLARKHKETHFLNATEAGLGIAGVENVELAQLLTQLPKKKDLSGLVMQTIAKATFPQDAALRIDKAMRELEKSMQRCEQCFTAILDQLAALAEAAQKEPELKLEAHTGAFALTEVELEQEPAFIYVLNIFNEVFLHLYNRKYRALEKKMRKARTKEQVALMISRLTLLQKTARVHLYLMNSVE